MEEDVGSLDHKNYERSEGEYWDTVSKHHFIHLQKVLNMPASNFDTFWVSPDYVMPNSREDFRKYHEDSSSHLYSCHKILLCLHGSLVY